MEGSERTRELEAQHLRNLRQPQHRLQIRFQGGHLADWIHHTFPHTGCALAIEFKKVFMDEWTGEVDDAELEALGDALAATIPGLLDEL